jgi:hypothetical protein
MNGYEAYKLYVAMKNHFNSQTYDFFKYGGKTRASLAAFEKRNDKHFFNVLAKHKDCQNYILANIVEGGPDLWVGDIANEQQAESNYLRWKARTESMTYNFTNDLDQLLTDYDDNLKVNDGQHPHLLKLVIQKSISLETLVILNDLCGFFKYWSRNITDPVVWPRYKMLAKKYRPFVPFDPQKTKKIVIDKFKT